MVPRTRPVDRLSGSLVSVLGLMLIISGIPLGQSRRAHRSPLQLTIVLVVPNRYHNKIRDAFSSSGIATTEYDRSPSQCSS